MSLACVTGGLESYQSSHCSKLFDHSSGWLRKVDTMLAIGESGAALHSRVAEIHGNVGAAELSNNVSADFGAARGPLNVSRAIFPIERLFSGKIFVEYKNGAWQRRGFISITMDVAILTARVLFPIKWLHNKGILDLGKHAQGFTSASFGLWASVITLDFIKNCQELSTVGGAKLVKCVTDLISNFLDLIALPFCFGYGMSGPPAVAITGLAIICLSKMFYLGKEVAFYSSS